MSKRFTLIELLVAIAIIGILASLLAPSLKSAREAGKRTVCVNNNKQMALAFVLFGDNNDDTFPAHIGAYNYSWDDYLGVGSYDGRNLSEATAKLTYVTNPDEASILYHCPTASYNLGTASNGAQLSRQYVDSNGYYSITYGANGGGMIGTRGDPSNPESGLGCRYVNEGPYGAGWGAKISSIAHSSETILMAEYVYPTKRLGWAGGRAVTWKSLSANLAVPQYHSRHNKSMFSVMAFTDGHAKFINVLSTYNTADDNMWDRE